MTSHQNACKIEVLISRIESHTPLKGDTKYILAHFLSELTCVADAYRKPRVLKVSIKYNLPRI